MKIVIIDYKMGNTQSIQNALHFLSQESVVSDDINIINQADAYILPGVGAFGEAMHNLHKLIPCLHENIIIKRKPILGICLGMQILANSSTEITKHSGLGWVNAEVVEINTKGVKVPHVGWNSIAVLKKTPLFVNIPSDTHFYFDHSFHFIPASDTISSVTLYGTEIVASIQQNNIFATQFHPEKSQRAGLKLLRNFLSYCEDISC